MDTYDDLAGMMDEPDGEAMTTKNKEEKRIGVMPSASLEDLDDFELEDEQDKKINKTISGRKKKKKKKKKRRLGNQTIVEDDENNLDMFDIKKDIKALPTLQEVPE